MSCSVQAGEVGSWRGGTKPADTRPRDGADNETAGRDFESHGEEALSKRGVPHSADENLTIPHGKEIDFLIRVKDRECMLDLGRDKLDIGPEFDSG